MPIVLIIVVCPRSLVDKATAFEAVNSPVRIRPRVQSNVKYGIPVKTLEPFANDRQARSGL